MLEINNLDTFVIKIALEVQDKLKKLHKLLN